MPEWLYTPGLRGSVVDRFWKFVDRREDDECWPWLGNPSSRGYGRMQTPLGSSTPSHRVSLLISGREIPDGYVVDHICRNRLCVNPHHLRAVTPAINTLENSISPTAINARKTHCIRGHELSGGNVRFDKRGRVCRTCQAAFSLKSWHKKQAYLKESGNA